MEMANSVKYYINLIGGGLKKGASKQTKSRKGGKKENGGKAGPKGGGR
jgi:hypothetical protein